jgi:hypothetical protein
VNGTGPEADARLAARLRPTGTPSPVGPDAELPWTEALVRVTGVVLVPLVAIFLITVLLRDPETVGLVFLSQRWENRLWLLADWGLLVVGSMHAVLALWSWAGRPHRVSGPEGPSAAAREAAAPQGWRLAVWAALSAFTAGLLLAASWAMLVLL